jgi:DNA-binding transcriptional LysR family regulator
MPDMHSINLRALDLNLLPVFEAAYEERSLSRAALRLAMTQPAVSHALSRLRSTLRDELFVRQSRGVLPTPMADALYARVGEALGLVRAAVDESRGFDPRTSTRRFVVAIPHPLGPMLALRILQRLEREAPGISVAFSTRSRPVDLEARLWEGRFDLAVDWLRAAREGLVEEALTEDQLVVVARRGHPATRGSPQLKSLSERWRFVSLRPRLSAEEQPPELAREWSRIKPRVALQVSEMLEVLAVASQSDLLGLVPMTLAKAASGAMDIQAVRLATPLARFTVRMAWRPSRGPDDAHAFLRAQVRAALKETLPGSGARRR